MARPDYFIIAGAQRSGTTYLYRLLDEHPEITMARPVRPEPKFFLGPNDVDRSLDAYARLFDGAARVRGEKSTSYIESEPAARRIRALLPDARIVFVMRDPVERAISNYRFSVENGLETVPIGEAFRREDERREAYDKGRLSTSPFAYLQRGRYADYLDRYSRIFPRRQLHVLLFERLTAGPTELRRLLDFLGVDPSFQPVRLGTAANRSEGPPPEVDPDLRRFLVRHFNEPNRRLAAAYGLDLSPWQGGAR